jgi:hypothetical protein
MSRANLQVIGYATPLARRDGGWFRPSVHVLTWGGIAAALIGLAGWASTAVFPNTSRGVLLWPMMPALTTLVLAGWAVDLFRAPRTRGRAVGLWLGSGVALTVFCFWAIGIGYFSWFVVP